MSDDNEGWSCPNCETVNGADVSSCVVCEGGRPLRAPGPPAAAAADVLYAAPGVAESHQKSTVDDSVRGAVRRCDVCQSQVDSLVVFCPQCGSPVSGASSAAGVSSATSPVVVDRVSPSRGRLVAVIVGVLVIGLVIGVVAFALTSRSPIVTTTNAVERATTSSPASTASTLAATSLASSSTVTTRSMETIPTTLTTPPVSQLGNDLGPQHAGELAAIDRFYQAVVGQDWDYTRAHFINGDGDGPQKDNDWWISKYGSLREYTLVPVRADGATLWIGLVTHESQPNGDPYSNEFCIPFTVSTGDFVRQTAAARVPHRVNGQWEPPEDALAGLMQC